MVVSVHTGFADDEWFALSVRRGDSSLETVPLVAWNGIGWLVIRVARNGVIVITTCIDGWDVEKLVPLVCNRTRLTSTDSAEDNEVIGVFAGDKL